MPLNSMERRILPFFSYIYHYNTSSKKKSKFDQNLVQKFAIDQNLVQKLIHAKFITKKSYILEYYKKNFDSLQEQPRIMYGQCVLIVSSIENYIFIHIFKRKIIILIHFSYFFTKPNSAKMENVICHFFHFF